MSDNTEKSVVRINMSRLSLRTKPVEGKFSKLTWSLRDGYPRITVFLPDDASVSQYERMIILPFTFTPLLTFFKAIEKVSKGDAGEYSIVCYNMKWENNVKTDQKITVGRVTVKKSEDGIIGIYVIAKDKPEMRFDLLMDDAWHKMYKNGSDITTTGLGSTLYAEAYAKTMHDAMVSIMTKDILDNATEQQK